MMADMRVGLIFEEMDGCAQLILPVKADMMLDFGLWFWFMSLGVLFSLLTYNRHSPAVAWGE